MQRKTKLLTDLSIIGAFTIAGCSSGSIAEAVATHTGQTETDPAAQTNMSFFLTSVGPGYGASLGGLLGLGADAHCAILAESVGLLETEWRAYLSTTTGANGVNASERIGAGPWVNANGVTVANGVVDRWLQSS